MAEGDTGLGDTAESDSEAGGPASRNHAGGDVTAQAGTPPNLPSEGASGGDPQGRPLGQGESWRDKAETGDTITGDGPRAGSVSGDDITALGRSLRREWGPHCKHLGDRPSPLGRPL